MNTTATNNNVTEQGNGKQKTVLMLTATVLLAGMVFFMVHRRKLKYENGNIQLPNDKIVPVTFDPNKLKVQVIGFRIHKIALSGITFSCDVKIANTSSQNLKIDDFGAELYHTKGNQSRFLTATDNTKSIAVGKHKVATINDVKFTVSSLTLVPTIKIIRSGGSREATIKVVFNANGIPVQQTQKINLNI